jgi:effector-binding domain-containing protein
MYEVTARELVAQPTLVVIGKARAADIREFLGRAFGATAQHIQRSGLDFAGPPFARYRALDSEFSEFEIEAGFPVDRPGEGEADITPLTLPAGPVAVVVHFGAYDQMAPAYLAIARWMEEHGAEAEGAAWEVYFSDPEEEGPDPSTWRTGIVQPYKPAIEGWPESRSPE